MASKWRAAESRPDGSAGREFPWRAHRSVLRAVAGAHADAQDGSGEGFQLAAWWCGGQVAGAVTGVDAGDEHHEYGGYSAGQKRGDDEQDNGGGISGLRFRRLIWRSGSRGSPFPGPGKSGDRDGRAGERENQ